MKKLLVCLCILAVILAAVTISVRAYDNNIKSQITGVETKISTIAETQTKTHELAEYYRQTLPPDILDEVIPNLQSCWNILNEERIILSNQLDELNKSYDKIQSNYLGMFKLTGYCSCSKCCGKWAGGPTASGVMPQEGTTIAVDTKVIPMGTKVYIENIGYRIAQDIGGGIKDNKIDVYVSSHANCYKSEYNQKSARVWVVD